MNRVCPRCHAAYAGADSFCPVDGARLVEPSAPADPRLGQVLGERFLLEQRLGEGGMGVVYRARHVRLERDFAVKLLHTPLKGDAEAEARFLREARAMGSLAHENIASLYDYGHSPAGEAYLVMEYVAGVSLGALLRERGPLALAQGVEVALGVARGLAHAHGRGVVHRDIKPENVCLEGQRLDPDAVKLLDFGIARLMTPAGQPGQPLTRADQQILGTPAFIPPELVNDIRRVSPAVDIYALGVLLHEALCGQTPFSGTALQMMFAHLQSQPPLLRERYRGDGQVPAGLETLVSLMLAKEPTQRPSAEACCAALEQLRALLPTAPLAELFLAETVLLDAKTRLQPRALLSATVLLPTVLGEVAQLEAAVQRASEELAQQVEVAVRPGVLPGEAARLLALLRGAEALEGETALELALAGDRVREEHRRKAQERSQLRQEIMTLGDRLRVAPPGERAALGAALLEREHAYGRLHPTAASAAEPQQQAAHERLRVQRAEVHRLRRALAEQLSATTARAVLRQALDRYDASYSLLAARVRAVSAGR